MADHHDDFLPHDLVEVEQRLRAERPQASPLELDRIKLEARARARRRVSPWSISMKGRPMRSRYLVLALTVLLLGGTTAGGIAGGGGSSDGGGAANSQYRPPKCNPQRNVCKCPDGSSFNDGQLQCVCPQGEQFNDKSKCVSSSCPNAQGIDGDGDTDGDHCEGNKPPPPPPCQDNDGDNDGSGCPGGEEDHGHHGHHDHGHHGDDD